MEFYGMRFWLRTMCVNIASIAKCLRWLLGIPLYACVHDSYSGRSKQRTIQTAACRYTCVRVISTLCLRFIMCLYVWVKQSRSQWLSNCSSHMITYVQCTLYIFVHSGAAQNKLECNLNGLICNWFIHNSSAHTIFSYKNSIPNSNLCN